MKRGTPNHPKVRNLADALGLPAYAAVGLLECLWHFTASYAPAGDVGRWTDAEIAKGLGWEGEPDAAIEALIACRWIDRHEVHRLIVHHWSEHAEDSIHKGLAEKIQHFADGQRPKLTKVNREDRHRIELAFLQIEHDGANAVRTRAHLCAPVRTPCLALPSQAKRESGKSPPVGGCPLDGFAGLRNAFPEIEAMLRAAHPKAKPMGDADRGTLAKLARIDRYPETEIVAALRWLFEAAHPDAEFWRGNVHALAPLRKAKDGTTKFARIHEAWKRAAAGAKAARVELPEHLRRPPGRAAAGDTP